MNYSDLPSGWAQRPITDVDVFEGVIDLIATDRSRSEGALHMLLCHRDGRLLQPVTIDAPEWGREPDAITASFATLFTGLHEQGVPAVVMTIARPGGTEPTPVDLKFRDALRAASAASGLPLLGLAVAAPSGIVTVPLGEGEDDVDLYADADFDDWLTA